jgi:hypothetical protein
VKTKLILSTLFIGMLILGYISQLSTQPSFNGSTPGCGASGCHTRQAGIVSVRTSNLSVSITLSGATGNVAGELVNSAGTVVTSSDLSSANPFTLTAPAAGTYKVNAGYKSPNKRWDSLTVTLGTAAGVSVEAPFQFALEQNYPNPFNPSTAIRYSISSNEHVTLKVFTLLGAEVATLVDQSVQPGSYEARWNADSFSGGVYFYRLQTEKSVITRKMLLLK